MNIIDFENVHVGYDNTVILKEITLKIKEHEHWAILGANGSGKSTLLKLFQSELHPRSDVEFKKEIMGERTYSIFDLKKKLGIITNALHDHFAVAGSFLDGYEVVLSGFYSSIGVFKYQDFTAEQHQKALDTLAYLEMEHLKEKKVYAMSTGELRRCIVARAFIHDPKAFILDEPTTGLDIKAQRMLIRMLQQISKHASIILVTHHLEEVFEEITHVALLHQNTIFKSGPKDEILTSKELSKVFDMDLQIAEKEGRYYIESIHE